MICSGATKAMSRGPIAQWVRLCLLCYERVECGNELEGGATMP